MCLISDIMNGTLQSYIGFPLMSVCCKNGTLEESTSYAISQAEIHYLTRLCGATYLEKKKRYKTQRIKLSLSGALSNSLETEHFKGQTAILILFFLSSYVVMGFQVTLNLLC